MSTFLKRGNEHSLTKHVAGPNTIKNCVAWYRADLGITLNGSTVSQWNDQTGSDANKHLVQTTVSKQATYNSVDAAYNGKPTLSFMAASSQYLQSNIWATPLNQPSTVFVVGNCDGAVTNQYFVDGYAQNTLVLFNSVGTTRGSIYAGTLLNSTIPASASPTIIAGVFNTASSVAYVNSFSPSITGQAGAANATGITLGSAANGSVAFLNGKIAEVICYSRVLSADEITQVTLYLSSRYAITVANAPQLVGLSAWYRSTDKITLNGSTVSAWDDLSGSGDANKKLLQATAARQPTLVSSAPQFNNAPVLQFTGANSNWMASGVWASAMPQPYTAIFVGNSDGAAAVNEYFIDGLTLDSGDLLPITSATSKPSMYAGASLPGGTLNDKTPMILGGIFNGASSSLFFDSKTAIATGNAGASNRTGVTLGSAAAAAGGFLNGNIAEGLFYSRILSQDEINVVFDYLRNRYFPTPKLPGLVAWFDPAQNVTLNGSSVSAWGDASNAGDVNHNLTQGTAAKQPTFIASDPAYNNKPTLSFNSANSQFLTSTAWATALPVGNTIFVVGNMDGTATNQAFYDTIPGSPHEQVLDFGGGSFTAASTASMTFGTYNANRHVLGMVWNGASSIGYDNAKTGTTGNTGTGGATGLCLGTYQGQNSIFLNGKIAECIVYNRPLSNEEVGLVMAYLGTKYGITIGA